jgi:ABC-type long-subunit fatty acid transport system fused permease/ATPase subunit
MLTGRVTKDSADVRRFTVDFSQWLDAGETISALTTPVIVIELTASWTNGTYISTPPIPPTDTTPLVIISSAILITGLQVQVLCGVGTPGLTYKITFVVTGASSGRQKQIDVLVTVRQPV